MHRHGMVRIVTAALLLLLLSGATAFGQADVPEELFWRPSDASQPATARHAMVVSIEPWASQAGLRILQQGGNAVDAAVAVAATLSVVRGAGIGPLGSGYALIYIARDDEVYVADFNGEVPSQADPSVFHRGLMESGPLASSIPGNLKGWDEMVQRFGRLSFAEVLAPAIELAEKGFPLSALYAGQLNGSFGNYAAYDTWVNTYYYRGVP